MPCDLDFRKRLALEIARQIRKNTIALHPLKQLFWECTLRCTLHCRHCGSSCQERPVFPDMSVSDFISVIDTITPHVNPHEVNVIITGGEPLLRDDIEACGEQLYQRGYSWGIVTNGFLLSKSRLDSLANAGMQSISISLDGFEADHNWLRGHNESFSRAENAISLLAARSDILWDVVTCVHQRNLGHLLAFRNYLVNLGVRNWRIFTIFPVGRAANEAELQLTSAQFKELLEFIKRMRKSGGLHIDFACEGFLGSYEGEVRDYFYSCNAGICIASILADGSISACPSIRSNYHQGNIYQDDFMDVWENRFQVFRNREWAKKGLCAECKMFRYCEGNGMHLRDANGDLLVCHYHKLT